ncbi:MAG: LPS assembly lipoprotein LptE [Nitrospiria bacterium]
MWRKNWSILWQAKSSTGALLLLVFMGGCGYQASLEKSPPSNLIKENERETTGVYVSRIEIPVFNNKTFEPLIENTVTRRFRQQVIMDGHLKLAAFREKSDMVLEGNVVSFGQDPLSFDLQSAAAEYRISVVLQMTLKDSKSGKILWQKPAITGTADYYVNVDASLNRAALDRAIDEASKVLAEDTLSEILNLYR